jgi:hypothetical protein
MKDLFNHIDKLPTMVREIVLAYSEKLDDSADYKTLEQFIDDLHPHGYTFDYGLDGVPQNLRRSRKIDIYEIAERSKQDSPYYFSPDTLKAFGQTMGKFKVSQQPDGRYMISAKSKQGFTSIRYFNPLNNRLEHN